MDPCYVENSIEEKERIEKEIKISEPFYVENSIEERERIEKETKITSNLSQKNTEEYSANASFIPESDSEEDRTNVKKCLQLNRKPNKVEKDDKKQAVISEINTECNSKYFPSSPTLSRDKSNEVTNATSRNIENEHLWTPKKKSISNKQKANNIISDSDTDSSRSKYSGKGSPRKEWVGPDIRLNLKDLGLNKQLNSWIESIREKPVMSTIPVSFIL